MWGVSKSLAGYSQQDAHEFFISVLNEIHNNSGLLFWCRVVKLLGFKSQPCPCIVHETFSGILQSNVKCMGCGNITTTLDPFLDISLELKTQQSKTFSLLGVNYDCTLLDCLERYSNSQYLGSNPFRFTQSEPLGTDQYRCIRCGNRQEATKQLSMKLLPPILSFQMKASVSNSHFS